MILDYLKQLMGGQKKSRRPTLDEAALNAPVAAARLKLEAAQAEHTATIEKANAHAAELNDAIAAFDADGGNKDADRVVEARRAAKRHSMFTERTQRILDRAAAAHREAEATRDAAVLGKLDEIYNGAHAHAMQEWEATGLPGAKQLVAFLDELDKIFTEAEQAGQQSSRLRGDEKGHLKFHEIAARKGAFRSIIERDIGIPSANRIASALGHRL